MKKENLFYSNQLKHMHELVIEALVSEIDRIVVEQAVLGVFFCGVALNTGTAGLCVTPMAEIPEAICCPSSAKAFPMPGKQKGRKVSSLLQDLYSPFPLRRALALAGLNALIEFLWTREQNSRWFIRKNEDAYDALTIMPDSRVVLVGAFPPYMKKLRSIGNSFSLMELSPSILKEEEIPHLVSGNLAIERLNQADIAIITGTTLLNGSFDWLMENMRLEAQAALIGPTVPLLPKSFEDTPVKVLGGVHITHPFDLLAILAEAGSGYHFFKDVAYRVTLVHPCL